MTAIHRVKYKEGKKGKGDEEEDKRRWMCDDGDG